FLLIRPPTRSPLFPYTTLFRSRRSFRSPRREARHADSGRSVEALRHAVAGARGRRRRPLPRGPRALGEEHGRRVRAARRAHRREDRKSTRLNSSHVAISYAVFG